MQETERLEDRANVAAVMARRSELDGTENVRGRLMLSTFRSLADVADALREMRPTWDSRFTTGAYYRFDNSKCCHAGHMVCRYDGGGWGLCVESDDERIVGKDAPMRHDDQWIKVDDGQTLYEKRSAT